MIRSKSTLLGAAAACTLWAAAAQAQMTVEGGQVNISGATLFQNFFSVPASTNDWINANYNFWDYTVLGSPCAGRVPWVGYLPVNCSASAFSTDQLATGYVGGANTWWLVQYRGVGSVNGLAELVEYQLNGTIPGPTASVSYVNRLSIAPGSPTPQAQTSIDIAVLDVPATWATVEAAHPADAAWYRQPTANGYGQCPLTSYVPVGTGFDNRLVSLVRGDQELNLNVASPDANTLFDTPVCWAPIAIVANRGTGLQNVSISALQTLFVTGRMPSGENLAAGTRSKGSGTRNGAMNSLQIDPSWGNGDNMGLEWVGSSPDRSILGPDHQVTNCEGSGELRKSVQHARLGVGYNGINGSSGAAQDMKDGKYEILNVWKDIDGDGDNAVDVPVASYVRPGITSIVANADPATGWQIGGPETFITRGDPFGTDIDITPAMMNSPQTQEPDPGIEIARTRTTFAMTNVHAAAYIRNIMESVAAFGGNPSLDNNTNSPGEFMAFTFFNYPAVNALPEATHPTRFIAQTPNTTLQSFVMTNNELAPGKAREVKPFGNFNIAGLVPLRKNIAPATYSDGSSRDYYNPATGTFALTANTVLNERNQTAGDFDYRAGEKHVRNLNDITAMMGAIHDPRAADAGKNWDPVTSAGGNVGGLGAGQDKAIAEILGDHNGDGNFDDEDVRYAADGLALDGGSLNRKKGFQTVDDAWTYADVAGRPAGNYFNTTLATGKPYVAGDSRADIAGAATAPTPGASPIGSDGVVNAADIDYVCFNTHWTEVGGLIKIKMVQPGTFSATVRPMDLSADMNGDLTVDQLDVDEIVHVVLGTEYGDVNLDGLVDAADEAIINANLGQPGAWAAGNLNCDGVVDQADHDIWAAHVETYTAADFNHDHRVDTQDVQQFNNCFSGPAVTYADGCAAFDLDGDTDVDLTDFGRFQKCYSGAAYANPACVP